MVVVGGLLLALNDAHYIFIDGFAAQPGGQELVHFDRGGGDHGCLIW